jgi:hypothetical protein
MARSNERPGKDGGKRQAQSAITDRQRRLAEEDAKIRAEEERIKRMLDSAPKKREELAKKQRDEFIKRKTKVVQIDRPVDNRFDAITAARPTRSRKMRKERTFSQLLTLLLFIVLILALYYAFRVMGRS